MAEKKYNILIIDDDTFLLDMYSFKFKEAGHTVDVAKGPDEALQKLRAGGTFDVILCDVVMPGMDGFQLLQTIRTENLSKNAILMILSNRGERADLDKAAELGIDSYIVKARTIPSEVLDQVLKAVERHMTPNA